MEKSVVSLLSCFDLCRRVDCLSSFAVIGRCCRGPFNSCRRQPLLFLETFLASLQPFFLGILTSDGRNSSFMPHIVGREVAGLIMDTMVIVVFFYVLSQKHKTALHVQHPTRNLHTYTCVRTFSTCCLNKRQHTTRTTPYNTRNLHTYTCVCTFLPVGSTQDSTLHAHHPTRNLHTYTCRTFIYTYPGTAVVLFKSIVAIFTPILRFFLSFSFVFRGCLAQFESFSIFLECSSIVSIVFSSFSYTVRTFADSQLYSVKSSCVLVNVRTRYASSQYARMIRK